MGYTPMVRTSTPALTSAESAARAFPLLSWETLFFWSATRRTSTPRFFARKSAAVTGALVKLYDRTRSSLLAESMTLTTSASLPSFGEKATSMVPARHRERVMSLVGIDEGLRLLLG